MRRELKGLALTEDGLRGLAIAARANASGLLSAARVLCHEGHLALARAISLMALEELGKVVLCLEGLFGSMTPSDVLDAWDIHREKLSRGHQFALLHVADHPVTTDLAEWLTRVVETDLAGKLQALYVDPSPAGGVTQVAVERSLVVKRPACGPRLRRRPRPCPLSRNDRQF